MNPKLLLSIAFLIAAAAPAVDAAPSHEQRTQPSASTRDATQSDWFEMQRQLTDGNVNPNPKK